MDQSDPTARHRTDSLRGWVTLNIAFEEAAMETLADGAALFRREGREAAAQEFEDIIRRHRVGLLKHRAMMGAHGIKA